MPTGDELFKAVASYKNNKMFARITFDKVFNKELEDVTLENLSQIKITIPHYYKIEFIKDDGGIGYIHMNDIGSIMIQNLPDK